MRRGRRLEPVVLDMYEEEHGAVDRNLTRIDSVDHPFMFASLDARRVDDARPVEAKTVGARMLREWGEGPDDVPQEYLIQVMHKMIVTKATSADLAALTALDDFRVYTIAFDAELAEMIVEGLRAFWDRVVNRQPPEPTTGEEVERLYRRPRAEGVEAPPEVAAAHAELLEVRAAIRPLEKREAALIDDIKKFLADRDALLVQGVEVLTWRCAKDSVRFDTKRFQTEQPETYAKYLFQSPGSRRLLIKGEKDAS